MASTEAPSLERQGPVIRTAWDWVLRLRQPTVGEQDVADWMAWYEAHEDHKDAFDYMQAMYLQMDKVAEGPGALSPSLWLDAHVPPAPAATSRASRRKIRLAAAAVAAACAIGLALQYAPLRRGTQDTAAAPALQGGTAVRDEVRESFLADGSHVQLATATAITVELTDRQRTVVMQQGAAYFTVAHNSERPFIVKAGGFDVRAIGTAFNVRRAGRRTVVTVAEGVVEVYPDGSENSVRARAGTEVAWTDGGRSPIVNAVDPAQALAWQRGNLDYASEPLESVIADINRYSRRRVIIHDAAVGDILIWGTVRTDSVEQWVEALPSLFPVSLDHDADGNLVLRARVVGGNT